MFFDALNQPNQSLRDDLKAIGSSDAAQADRVLSAAIRPTCFALGQNSRRMDVISQRDVEDVRIDVYFSQDLHFVLRAERADLCLSSDRAFKLICREDISFEGTFVELIRFRECLGAKNVIVRSFASCFDDMNELRITLRDSSFVYANFADGFQACPVSEAYLGGLAGKVSFETLYGGDTCEY